MLHNKLSILCCMLSLVIVTICSTNTAQRSGQVTRLRGRVRNDYKKLPVAETFRSVIVHLDRWTFEDIESECKNRLGRAGYAAVQVSPVTRHAKPDPHYPGLERISVVSYEIDSDSGTEGQLLQMITECNKNKVRVLIDVVLNHMMKEIDDDGRNQKDKIKQKMYGPVNEPAMFFSKYFHDELYLKEEHYKKGTFEFRKGMLAGRHDLRQIVDGAPNVHMFGLLYKLISMGAAGFRVLNADHMDPEDLVKLYDLLPDVTFEKTPTRPFIYSDVYDPIAANDWAIQDEDYVKYTRVTDYKFAYQMATVFLSRNKKLSRLQNFGLEKQDTPRGEARVTDGALRVSEDSVVFVNTPMTDLFKTRGVTQFPVMPYEFINPEKNFKDSKLAVGFMLTYGHGMPLISTPFNVKHREPYHRKADIERIVTWRNYILNVTNGKFPAISEWDFKLFSNQGSFCVGDHGFVVFNGEKSEALDRISTTCFKRPGVYCDILSGGPNRNNIAAGVKGGELVCYGKYITVGEDKKAHIKLGKDDIMQLYTSELVGQPMNIAQKSGDQEKNIAQQFVDKALSIVQKSDNQEMSLAQQFVDKSLSSMAIGIFVGTAIAGHPGAALGAVIGSWFAMDGKERIMKSWYGGK